MKKLISTATLALAASGLTLAVPSSAAVPTHSTTPLQYEAGHEQVYEHGRHHKRKWKRGRGHNRDYAYQSRYRDSYDSRYRDSRPYYSRYASSYGEPVYRDTRIWRGNDGRYYCRKENGTTGLLVGAGVGALIGHEVAGRGGDRTLGAILGAAGGALLGRTIDRSSTRCG